jgi:phage terminase Nu1 subunit (DNA packaging protein)
MSNNDNNADASNRSTFALTTKQAAQRYNISIRTLSVWREQGMPFMMIGPRKALFVVADCDQWVRTKFTVVHPKQALSSPVA